MSKHLLCTRYLMTAGRKLKSMISTLIVFLIFLLTAFPVMSQEDFWAQTKGPEGGQVKTIWRSATGDLFLAMRNSARIYRSSDKGVTWKLLTTMPSGDISFAADTSGNLFAGVACGLGTCDGQHGIWKSTDNGDTWTNLEGALSSYDITSLFSDPDGNLYACADVGNKPYFVRSADDGANWQTVDQPSDYIKDFAAADGNLFVADSEGGILRSKDGGNSWNSIGFSKTSSKYRAAQSLAVDSKGTLFAGVEPDGVVRSGDGGDTWTNVSTGLPAQDFGNGPDISVFSMDISENDEIVVSLGSGDIFLSTNSGDTWSDVGDPDFKSRYGEIDNVLFTGNNGIIASLDDRGVFRTDDIGITWSPSNSGLVDANVSILTTTSTGELFAGNADIFHSINAGDSWEPFTLPVGSLPIGGFFAINSNDELYVVADSLYRSDDSGISWVKSALPWAGDQNVWATGIIFNQNNDIFVTVFDNNPVDGDVSGIYRSTDNGSSWDKLSLTGETRKLAVAGDGTLYAGRGYPDNDIYFSNDNGDTWMQTAPANYDYINDIKVFPDGTVVVGCDEGLFSFSPGDSLWTNINSGLPASPDNTDPIIQSLFVTKEGVLYAGISGQGVYVSTDKGDSWTAVNSGLGNLLRMGVLKMAIANGTLFAGTYSSGIFRSQSPVTGVDDIAANGHTFALDQNYPNPFNIGTKISFNLPKQSQVDLSVFNLSGQLIKQLINSKVQPGNHIVIWDGRDEQGTAVSGGLYFYTIRTTDFIQTKKMFKLR